MEQMAPKAFPSARVATIGVAWFVLLVSLGIQARPSAQQPAPQAKGPVISQSCHHRVEPSRRSIATASPATTNDSRPRD